ncbi:MAG: hypothetical protein Fur0010_11230 [Bdellovibrio sp.]
MEFLKDPEMQEIIDGFVEETNGLLLELRGCLEDFENDPTNNSKLEEFGQKIDRIMGAAKTIGADAIGKICALGKMIGYKASQSSDVALNQIVCGVMFDCVDLLEEMMKGIEKRDMSSVKTNVEAFISRMKWLAEKFKHIERSSVAIESEKPKKKKVNTTPEFEKLLSGGKK